MLLYVGSEVLTAIIMESATYLSRCNNVNALLAGCYLEDASSMVLRNVCELVPDYTTCYGMLQNVYNPITTGMFEKK